MSPDHIHASGRSDQSYTILINAIKQGSPSQCFLTEHEIYDFWEVQHRLSNDKDLVLMDGRIVVLKYLRGKVLRCLHLIHPGVDGIKAWANDSVYWLGMNASIRNFRANCLVCKNIAPNQPWETITITPTPGMAFSTNSNGPLLCWTSGIPRLCR